MFKVQANKKEPGNFELTDSEIREARHHARERRWRLLVVSYVFDPNRCRVMRLPNPFDPRFEGDSAQRIMASGIAIASYPEIDSVHRGSSPVGPGPRPDEMRAMRGAYKSTVQRVAGMSPEASDKPSDNAAKPRQTLGRLSQT